MNDDMQRTWDIFARAANWTMLHDDDLGRFALFVKAGHEAEASTPDFDDLVVAHVPDDDVRSSVTAQLATLWDFGIHMAILYGPPKQTRV